MLATMIRGTAFSPAIKTIMIDIMDETMKPFKNPYPRNSGGSDGSLRIKILRGIADDSQASIGKKEDE